MGLRLPAREVKANKNTAGAVNIVAKCDIDLPR
jgi:hypothetical protein